MRTSSLVLILILLLSLNSFAADCSRPLNLSRSQSSSTERFIGYLTTLVERRILGFDELSRMTNGLKRNQLVNPFVETDGFVNSQIAVHRGEIESYLKSVDLEVLLKWCEKAIEQNRVTTRMRKDAETETSSIHYKMTFFPALTHPTETRYRSAIARVYPFEMMSTPVTQRHWVEVMGYNPSEFKKGDATVFPFKGQYIPLNPDHPVESVSWWSAIVFANRLSEKEGYKPAYDVSKVKFSPTTSAEKGDLAALSGFVSMNAEHSADYVEGYRLPTHIEAAHVLRQATHVAITDHAWYKENSDNHTHPVALRQAVLINGNPFYDLLGNVWEWTYDNQNDATYEIVGGAFYLPWNRVMNGEGSFGANFVLSSLGFRLVRSLKKPPARR